MAEKSILEQALLQIETLEEAVKQNAKGIISSTMKKELNELLKESKEEEDDQVSDDDETSIPDEEETDDMASDDESDDEESDDEDVAADDDTDLDNDPTKDIDSLDAGGEDEPDADNAGGPSDYDADNADDDTMDMTGASDEEVMKVFKAMKPEDGIVVKKDGNTLTVNDGDDEYIIKLDDIDSEDSEPFTSAAPDEVGTEDEVSTDEFSSDDETVTDDFGSDSETDTDEFGSDNEFGDEDGEESDEDESIYEITLDDSEDKDGVQMQADEAARTKSNPHGNKNGMKRAGLPSKKTYKAGSAINEEVETLKKQNGEYKKALVLFKDKLNEVAIFNANLAYFTRLVTENSTTKQEKLNILKRFDSVSTMNESKSLFKTIEAELGSKKSVTESVVNKISNTPTTSSSQETLTESKAYENPQFKRMKDLMSKIK
jgi:hypothetical protein